MQIAPRTTHAATVTLSEMVDLENEPAIAGLCTYDGCAVVRVK